MVRVEKKEVDQAYEALNKANYRISRAAEKINSCQQELESLERTLRSKRDHAQSAGAQQEYSHNDNSVEERIAHLESLVSGARDELQKAEEVHQQEREAQQTAQAQAQKLLSRIEQALNSVHGNIQKLRAQTGKPAEWLQRMVRIEQQQQSALEEMRRRLAAVLKTSYSTEKAGPSRSSGNGGLEGIISRVGGGPMASPLTHRVTYVREEVVYRRAATYTVQEQMAADPYVYPHPDNYTPLYQREPWRTKELFRPAYQRTLVYLPYCFR